MLPIKLLDYKGYYGNTKLQRFTIPEDCLFAVSIGGHVCVVFKVLSKSYIFEIKDLEDSVEYSGELRAQRCLHVRRRQTKSFSRRLIELFRLLKLFGLCRISSDSAV
jgi:hypothetical protein